MLIEIYGHSDDNVCWRINGKPTDEVGCYQSGNDLHHCTLIVSSIGGTHAVKVHVIYDGCWSFAVGMVDEDRGIPVRDWSIRVDNEHGYSTKLIINTGDELVTVAKAGGM